MKRIALLLQVAFLTAVVLGMTAAPAVTAPTTVSFKVVKAGTPVANTEVVIYLSYGKEVTTTNANGDAVFRVGAGKGYWVEVGGRRLDRYFEIPTTPTVIDVATIPTKLWPKAR